MRMWVLAAVAALGLGGGAPAVSASPIADAYTSFYVTGDSLSDDGNLFGPLWYAATGGSPYRGSFWRGGAFTNGEVWNEPLLEAFDDAGRDARNLAVGRAETSGGGFLVPDLGRQISRLLDATTRGERGANPLASIWIGGNEILDALGSGGARRAAREAADAVAAGARRLARHGIDDLVILNLPDLARTPRYNLFERARRAEAREATRAYNRRLARNVRALEAGGIAVTPVDAARLLDDARRDPAAFGFANARLPCVFPSDAAARAHGEPRRCARDVADRRLFIDAIHPSARAHALLGSAVEDALLAGLAAPTLVAAQAARAAQRPETLPAPVPLPPAALLLGAALGGLALAGRRRARPCDPARADGA